MAPPDFLHLLTDEERNSLQRRAVARAFKRGAALLREGEAPTRVLVLTEGRAKAVTFTEDGKEVILGFTGPGELLGEVAAIDDEPRSATVIAVEPVNALALATPDFMALIVIRRLRLADLQRKEFAGSNTLGRVSRRLVELSDGEGEITLPISQEELASWTGASRESVAKALKQLRDLGWIETGRRTIAVKDREALRRFAR